MSEVHRYKVQCMFSEGGSKIEYFPHGPSVVRAEDFDAQRLRADTAEAELAKLREAYKGYSSKLFVDALQSELAAAEQRIAQLSGLLREGLEEFKEGDDWIDRVVAALNTNPEAESNE